MQLRRCKRELHHRGMVEQAPPPRCPGCSAPVAEAGALCPDCLARVASLLDEPPQPGDAAGSPADAPQAGAYDLLERLGAGAMGEVWLARHHLSERLVALKRPRPELLAAQPWLASQFLREARLLSALHHPGILSIYELGADPQQPWFTTPICEGGSLAQALREGRRFPPREAVALIAQVADALGHAHAQGILHCDLKPSNILLDEFDRPLVADFGAGLEPPGGGENSPRRIFTSADYTAPEVEAGAPPSAAADVHSLAMVLRNLLAASAPARDSRRWPADLRRILRHGLEPDPQDRYADAAEFAADLRAFLAGASVSVGPRTPLWRAVRQVRRHPRSALLLGLAALLVLAAGVAVQTQLARAEGRRAQAESERAALAAASAQEAGFQLDLVEVRRLLERRHAGDRQRILDLLGQHRQRPERGELRSLAIRALALADLELEEGDTSPRPDPAWSMEFLAPPAVGQDGWVASVAAANPRRILIGGPTPPHAPIDLPDRVLALAWCPGTPYLAIGGLDKRLSVWNSRSGELVEQIRSLASAPALLRANSDGRHLAVVTWDGWLHLWDGQRQALLVSANWGLSPDCALDWTDADHLAWQRNGQACQARVRFPVGVRMVRGLGPPGRLENFSTLALDGQRQRLAVTLGDGVHLWGWQGNRDQIRLLSRRDRGEWLGARWLQGKLWLGGWNSGIGVAAAGTDSLADAEGELPLQPAPHSRPGLVLEGTGNEPARLVLLDSPNQRYVLRALDADLPDQMLAQPTPYAASLSSDGNLAATSGFQTCEVLIHDLRREEVAARLPRPEVATKLAFAPGSPLLLLGGGTRVSLFDLSAPASPHRVREFACPETVEGLAWSADAKTVAVQGASALHLYRTEDGEPLARLSSPDPRPGNPLVAAAADPTQALWAVQLDDGSVILWDWAEIAPGLEELESNAPAR